MTKRLRLLHLEITPVFVEDNGEDLNVLRGETIQVSNALIPDFPERWATEFAAFQAHYEATSSEET